MISEFLTPLLMIFLGAIFFGVTVSITIGIMMVLVDKTVDFMEKIL